MKVLKIAQIVQIVVHQNKIEKFSLLAESFNEIALIKVLITLHEKVLRLVW